MKKDYRSMSVKAVLASLGSIELVEVSSEIARVTAEIAANSAYLEELQLLERLLGRRTAADVVSVVTTGEVAHGSNADHPAGDSADSGDYLGSRHLLSVPRVPDPAPADSASPGQSSSPARSAEPRVSPESGLTNAFGRVRKTITPGTIPDKVWQYLNVAGATRMQTISDQTGVPYVRVAGAIRDYPDFFDKRSRGVYDVARRH